MPGQLIPVVVRLVGTVSIPTVDARVLHEFLEVKTLFKDWISRRIEDFGFIEDVDFCSFLSESSGGRRSKEYALTLGMGKELSMVERNAKGKEARQYFIACEEKAKQAHIDPIVLLNDPSVMRSLLLTYSEKVISLETTVAERDSLISCIQPKAAIADRLAGADGNMCIRNAAKALKTRESDLIKWLQIHKWIFRNKKGKIEGYAAYTPRFIEHKVTPIPVDGDEDRVSLQAMITPEGLTKLASIFNAKLELG